ncbi:MAG: hypothetical protein RI945_277 [Candidatus Parcubacteria bacterium]
MKIVLTGAGGGHFYPLIAVAERIKKEVELEQIIDSEIFFFSDKEYNSSLLEEKSIKYIHIPAGKMRLYFSLENILDPLKSFFGFFVALYRLFSIYPDVVFAKGGYSSLPVIFAAKVLFIPIFIHESDSSPGRTNIVAGRFAKRIALSYAGALKYFDIKKTAYTGQPIMREYLPSKERLEKKSTMQSSSNGKKNIFVLGGSQGSETINNMILEVLPTLLEKYNIIHQVGENNFNKVKISSEIILKDNPNKENYHYFAFDDLAKYYEVADICVTRAGSSLFEMSAWGIPTIIIPITVSNNNHQMLNAYTFEKAECSIVIEEVNLKKGIFLNAINSILKDKDKYEKMRFNNLNNFKSGAAELIAKEIVKIGLSHNY